MSHKNEEGILVVWDRGFDRLPVQNTGWLDGRDSHCCTAGDSPNKKQSKAEEKGKELGCIRPDVTAISLIGMTWGTEPRSTALYGGQRIESDSTP